MVTPLEVINHTLQRHEREPARRIVKGLTELEKEEPDSVARINTLEELCAGVKTAQEGGILILPKSWAISDKRTREKFLKDETEAYTPLTSGRAVQNIARQAVKEAERNSNLESLIADAPAIKERAVRQNPPTKEFVKALKLKPESLYPVMMECMWPIAPPGQLRARVNAQEARGTIGLAFRTLAQNSRGSWVYHLIPWYAIVEASAMMGRVEGKGGLRISRHPKIEIAWKPGEARRFKTEVRSFTEPNKSYLTERNRVPYGSGLNASLQEWLPAPLEKTLYCSCGDYHWRALNNDRLSSEIIRWCKHLIYASMVAMTLFGGGDSGNRWLSNVIPLPLDPEQNYSEALRVRRVLTTRTLIEVYEREGEEGQKEGIKHPKFRIPNMTEQSLIYGALNSMLFKKRRDEREEGNRRATRSQGLFNPGILTVKGVKTLRREEETLSKDELYAQTLTTQDWSADSRA